MRGIWKAFLRVGATLGVALIITTIAQAAEKSQADKGESAAVGLFAAIENKQIDVVVRPKDAREIRLEVKNNTTQPLRIEMPKTLVAAPVQAQLFGGAIGPFAGGGGPFGGQGNVQGGNNQAGRGQMPQVLGGATQRNNNNQRGRQGGVFFNVPPEKAVRITVSTLCLEYGKREPNPRSQYELKSLESHSSDVALRELLEYYGENDCDTDVAQIAAWHLANNMSWDEMRKMTVLRVGGKIENVFHPQGIERARRLVNQLPSQRKQTGDESPAISASPGQE